MFQKFKLWKGENLQFVRPASAGSFPSLSLTTTYIIIFLELWNITYKSITWIVPVSRSHKTSPEMEQSGVNQQNYTKHHETTLLTLASLTTNHIVV
jgi:hypothetical protein